jgi:hypothetical protein
MDYQKILDNKLNNMETSPNKRKSMSVDALNNADHTSLSIDSVKKKYRSVSSIGSADANINQDEELLKNEEIDVKLIRNKDRSADASDPVGERTIIFNKSGSIMGAQG